MSMKQQDVLTLQEAADELEVHYMTAYRYVRIGALAATKHGKSWQVSREDLDSFQNQATPAIAGDPAAWTQRYKKMATNGDETGAMEVISAALDTKLSPAEVYTAVIGPALTEIGDDWSQGTLGVADEHRASKVTSRVLGQLSPRFRTRGAKRGTIVLGSVAGDEHELGGTMMADLLRSNGYAVDDLGANVPTESFAQACLSAANLLGVAIGSYLKTNELRLTETIAALRNATDAPIAVGGPAVESHSHALRLGASGYASNADDTLAIFLLQSQKAEPEGPAF